MKNKSILITVAAVVISNAVAAIGFAMYKKKKGEESIKTSFKNVTDSMMKDAPQEKKDLVNNAIKKMNMNDIRNICEELKDIIVAQTPELNNP